MPSGSGFHTRRVHTNTFTHGFSCLPSYMVSHKSCYKLKCQYLLKYCRYINKNYMDDLSHN